jgi:integrase
VKRRGPNGGGTLYKEDVPGRAARWVSESFVTLPDGRRRRVRARGLTPEAAVGARILKAHELQDAFPRSDRLTVRQLTERWFEARSRDWRPATVASYRTTLDRHVLPELGGARVALVGPMDAQRVVNRVLTRSGGAHVAAANRARRVMHALFAFGIEQHVARVNPVDGVRSVRGPALERGWWTRGQAVAFLTAASRTPYRDLFHAALETGLRMGELLALRWSDIDVGGVTVRRTFSRHVPSRIQEAPKSSTSRRTVPIPASLRERLETRRRAPADLVFPSRNGEVLNPSNVNRALKRIAARAGVPVLKFHDLRRTYASLLAEQGRRPEVIQRLLGHATVDLALRVYTSVSAETLAGAVVDLWGNSGGSRGGLQEPQEAPVVRRGAAEVAPDTLN